MRFFAFPIVAAAFLLAQPTQADIVITLGEAGVSDGTDVSSFYLGSDGVTFSTTAGDPSVFAKDAFGNNVFAFESGAGPDDNWGNEASLLASFTGFSANSVSFDFEVAGAGGGNVTLEAFGTSGSLGTTVELFSASPGTVTFTAGGDLITNVSVTMNGRGDIGTFDNFRATTAVPEPSSVLLTMLPLAKLSWRRSRAQA